MANKDLKWERTSSWNFGIDFGLFNQRLNGSFEVYKSKTSDVLVKRTLPNVTGYSWVWANLGGVENKGLEIELNSVNIQNSNFSWTSGFTFSLNRDKITELYGDGATQDLTNGWFVGESIGAIYSYEMTGVWQEEDLYSGEIYDGWYPGQQKFADLNGDGKEDDDLASKWFIGYSLGSNYDYVFDGIWQEGDDFSIDKSARPGDIKFKDLSGNGSIGPEDRMVLHNNRPKAMILSLIHI